MEAVAGNEGEKGINNPDQNESPTGVADVYSKENPEVSAKKPDTVETAPEAVESAPEAVESAPEAVESAPEVVESAPEEEGKADIIESPEIVSKNKPEESIEYEKQPIMTRNILGERIKKPDKSIVEKNKYNYAIDSALYIKNKFARTKKVKPVEAWDDDETQKWRTKTLKTFASILKLTNSRHTYKLHHRQLDKYRNAINNILNEINKVKVSGTKKKK